MYFTAVLTALHIESQLIVEVTIEELLEIPLNFLDRDLARLLCRSRLLVVERQLDGIVVRGIICRFNFGGFFGFLSGLNYTGLRLGRGYCCYFGTHGRVNSIFSANYITQPATTLSLEGSRVFNPITSSIVTAGKLYNFSLFRENFLEFARRPNCCFSGHFQGMSELPPDDPTNKLTLEQRILVLERELSSIHERNQRVAGNKAWEVSLSRRTLIAAITYFFAAILLRLIGSSGYLLNAAVPAAGYILSTLTLPWIKRRWIEQHYAKADSK